MVATLGRAIGNETYYEGSSVVGIFTAAVAQGALHFLRDIHTKIFADGFRDKIFDTVIVAALGRALSDETSYLRSGVVEFFTAAVAQGALRFFHRIFIPTYDQRGFGTRYLILRLLPHLDVHFVMKPLAWSNFSLLL